MGTRALVPARGAQRRLRALSRQGWSAHQLACQLGVHTATLDALLHDDGEFITFTGHQVIAELFDRIWAHDPPRATAEEQLEADAATAEAIARRWVSALAWDDIDEDDAPPAVAAEHEPIIDEIAVERAVAGARTRLTNEERLQAIHQLHDEGLGISEIAKILHANFIATRNAVAAYTGQHLTEAA